MIDKANKLMSLVSSDMPPPTGPVSSVHIELRERKNEQPKQFKVFNFQKMIIFRDLTQGREGGGVGRGGYKRRGRRSSRLGCK